MLEIASDKVAHIIIKSREYDAKVGSWDDSAKVDVSRASQYLLGTPLLADYLEEGLERLGISVEDAEKDVL
jgi:hypothetical protein